MIEFDDFEAKRENRKECEREKTGNWESITKLDQINIKT